MGVESVLSNSKTKAMKNRTESGVAGRTMMSGLGRGLVWRGRIRQRWQYYSNVFVCVEMWFCSRASVFLALERCEARLKENGGAAGGTRGRVEEKSLVSSRRQKEKTQQTSSQDTAQPARRSWDRMGQ